MQNKTCFVCGSFDHFAAYYDNNPWKKVNSRNTRVNGNNQVRVNNHFSNQTHSNVQKVPRAVMLRSGVKPLSTTRPNRIVYNYPTVSCARPRSPNYKSQIVNKPFFKNTARQKQKWVPKVQTAQLTIPTVRPKVETVKQKQVVKGNMGNGMKATAQWVWRPITGDKASMTLKKHTFVDEKGKVKSVMAWAPKV